VTLPEKSGAKGVYLNAAHNSYMVSVRKSGKQIFLGEFPAEMLDMAKACRLEAEGLPADQLPALRNKYARLRAEQGGHRHGERSKKNGHTPEVEREPEPDELDADLAAPPPIGATKTVTEAPTLAELIDAARAADVQMRLWQAQADEAARQAQAAQASAVVAWNAVIDELTRLGAEADSALFLTALGSVLGSRE